MTTQREPIHLALESAPRDRFDDDGPRVFRVVGFVGQGATRRHKAAFTRDHDTEAEAMAVFADKIKHAVNDHRVAPFAELLDRVEALEAKRRRR